MIQTSTRRVGGALIRQMGKPELDGLQVAGAINDGGGVDRHVADTAMKEGEDGGPPIWRKSQ